MLDLGKAVTASKEDDIKKSQQLFVKRLIAAVLVFIVTMVVKIVISFAADNDASVINCMNCFINGDVRTDQTSCILTRAAEE